jgi:hypothetical protein
MRNTCHIYAVSNTMKVDDQLFADSKLNCFACQIEFSLKNGTLLSNTHALYTIHINDQSDFSFSR